jgi:excisionase family DNA binding protein
MPGNQLLTIDEAARAMSMKPKTVRAWIAQRRISVVRPMGWSIRVPASEIDRIINRDMIPAVEERD